MDRITDCPDMISDVDHGRKALAQQFRNKNSAEVNIAPAFGEITTACNVGQAKKGHE